jgi:hypothetical protein
MSKNCDSTRFGESSEGTDEEKLESNFSKRFWIPRSLRKDGGQASAE